MGRQPTTTNFSRPAASSVKRHYDRAVVHSSAKQEALPGLVHPPDSLHSHGWDDSVQISLFFSLKP